MRLKRRWKIKANHVSKIFDSTTDDLSYITANEELLNKHIKFIHNCAYLFYNNVIGDFITLTKENETRVPRGFEYFQTNYKYIYKRWLHLVRCCYDPTYKFYKFFGAKGIRMSYHFKNAKKFCIWCLKNGITDKPFMYTKYIQRKDKNKSFSEENCYVITEKEVHNGKSVSQVLNSILMIRNYELDHHPSVSYMTYYTRCYIYDICEEDARKYPSDLKNREDLCGQFSPATFYDSIADEDSCTKSEFLSRMHALYLNDNVTAKPYELIKKDFSVNKYVNQHGVLSYKQRWDRKNKEKNNSENSDGFTNSNVYTKENSVYNSVENVSVYSK